MDLPTFEWLLTDDGQRLLDRAAGLTRTDPLKAAQALRDTATPEQAAAAMSQAVLREAAATKFGAAAARMYFTRDGLEQATRLRVSQHRAARIAMAASTVLDLGCGIGGDLLALSEAGLTVAGVDIDPLRVAIASANLQALDLPGAVLHADGTTLERSGFDVVFADPARRTAKGRTFDVNDFNPPWPFVQELLERPACIKTAPGIPHSLVPEGVEAEWVSDTGQVKEAVLWSSYLSTARRRATVIRGSGLASLTDEDDPGAPVLEVGAYLYEPDGAVIRAGLVTAVAAQLDGGLIDEHIAYVTSDRAAATPYARGFEVLETLPYQEKKLKAALRERGIGRLTIKKRGVDVVPEELRKRLSLVGDEEATVVLTRAGGVGTALLVRELDPRN